MILFHVQVVVAHNKRDGTGRDPNEEKLVRLYVLCPKKLTEKDLCDEFEVIALLVF